MKQLTYGIEIPLLIFQNLDVKSLPTNEKYHNYNMSYTIVDDVCVLTIFKRDFFPMEKIDQTLIDSINMDGFEDLCKELIDIIIKTYLKVIPDNPDLNIPTEFEFNWYIL